MAHIRTLLIRQRDLEGRTLHFITRTARRPYIQVFSEEVVPEFDGDSGWFEIHPGKRGAPPRLVGPFPDRRT